MDDFTLTANKKVLAAARSVDGVRSSEPTRPTRHDRRRLETRARLLRALMKLLARKSLADIAIHEITETADVGGGTFYNHFTDRGVIHAAMVDELLISWSDIVGAVAPISGDVAQTFAIRARLYIERAGQDPDWGRYVVANAFSQFSNGNPVGRRLLDLVDAGRRSNRFNVADLDLVTRAILGLVIATIHQVVGDPLKAVTEAGRTTQFALTLLGVPAADAEKLATLPLPTASWDDVELVRQATAKRSSPSVATS
jgi:AcrR family transcriptional regulator